MADKLYTQLFTQNRELSWLKFNARVLSEATDETVPLLERLKFVAIFSANLDEFFMIRVGSLFDLLQMKETTIDNKSGMSPQEQLDYIYKAVRPLYREKDEIYASIERQLRIHGIYELNYCELDQLEQKQVKHYFKNSIMPILSPQIIDSHHPFPHLQNNSIYIATMLKIKGKEVFGLVPIPSSLPEILSLAGNETRFISMEKFLLEFLDDAFDHYQVLEKAIIRITRNADLNFDDENFEVDSDFRKKMRKLLHKRKRLFPVRMEISNEISVNFQKYIYEKLGLKQEQVFLTKTPMSMKFAFQLPTKIPANKRKALTYKGFKPHFPREVNPKESILKQLQQNDLLLSYPYESMEPFLLMIKEAANDPNVVSIKITIYRLANKAKLVEYLCAAAENGKDVLVLIELRARFDEQNNIDWSERLEEAGCNIIYGFENFKVHSKICLITKRERNEIKYITQIGTGNYNEKTASMYTDLSLISYDQRIGQDAAEFFKNMGIGNLEGIYKHLLVAPISLKQTVIKLIDEQIALANKGHIFIKINSLTDVDIMEKLKQASCAGVKVIMIIRGICCLKPNIEGKTDNIHISSVVGRFLEHSRIYSFGTGSTQKIYISSADFMTRNTERRVEVACPIYDERAREKIRHIMEAAEYDNVKARVLLANGNYVKKDKHKLPIDSQQLLMNDVEKEEAVIAMKKKSFLSNKLIKKLQHIFSSNKDNFFDQSL
ncbi:polyphosphate kinase 1 [Anaerotignum sp.]|uniref:polyphosphate kinase 1 n=1 Tax=Anaerotignum sp. TaxID=2039241 RepID=UPI0028B10E2E|nr:polyphosphate kinase 1 [Anaerotignum sp.]